MNDDDGPDERVPAFKPFVASQVLKPEVTSAIAQIAKLGDLIPAFKPFIASEAFRSHVSAINAKNSALSKMIAERSALSKIFTSTAALTNIAETTKVLGSIQPLAASSLKVMSATSVLSRQLAESRLAERDLSEMWSAQVRRKADVEQAALDSADATTALVQVAHKQETVLESMAGLLGKLVTEQDDLIQQQTRATSTNRRRWRIAIAIATISAVAGVINLVVNWPH